MLLDGDLAGFLWQAWLGFALTGMDWEGQGWASPWTPKPCSWSLALAGPQEALGKAPGSKMFAFGSVALRQFVNIVYVWPQFCHRVLQVGVAPALWSVVC